MRGEETLLPLPMTATFIATETLLLLIAGDIKTEADISLSLSILASSSKLHYVPFTVWPIQPRPLLNSKNHSSSVKFWSKIATWDIVIAYYKITCVLFSVKLSKKNSCHFLNFFFLF